MVNKSLLSLVRELNTLNDDSLADRVIKDSDVQWCLSELQDILKAQTKSITKPNESLTCDGCVMQGEKVTPCVSCIRDPRVCDYYTRRPLEGTK